MSRKSLAAKDSDLAILISGAKTVLVWKRCFLLSVAVVSAMSVSGCATRLTQRGECKYRGFPKGSPGYEACREQLRQEGVAEAARVDAQTNQLIGNLLEAAVVGAAAYGAAQVTAPPTYYSNSLPNQTRVAPLSTQSTAGYARTCGYLTPSGRVTVTVSIAQPCPATYAY